MKQSRLKVIGGIETTGVVKGNREDFSNLSSGHYYSLENIMRQYEFQENGLRRYMHDSHDYNLNGMTESEMKDMKKMDGKDLSTLKANLYEDSYKVAIGGETELKDADLHKFYSEMTGEIDIPITGQNKTIKSKSKEGNLFGKFDDKDSQREDHYHKWLENQFEMYSMY